MRRSLRALVGIALAVLVVSCGGENRQSRTSPVGPSAITEPPAAGAPASGSTGASSGAASTPAAASSGAALASVPQDVAFPPRNEPLDFRTQLEAKYRDGLRRPAGQSYVDIEGDIVWTTEYVRYRVNGCGHQDAVDRVLAQIGGGAIAPVCSPVSSGAVNFPPRNEPFAFRVSLEATYRDQLKRSPTTTHVDIEGDIVWTQEYLRYRLNACGHAEAVQRVFAQIDGQGIQPTCVAANRTPDPPAGQRLPLPAYAQALVAQLAAARPDLLREQSCPRGLKYVNNPWQDYIIDELRKIDTRWGYNAKPNRTAADNEGVPVIAAGDEITYHYGPGPDEGSTDLYPIDILAGHCGPNPSVTWRVFTGEEPVRWTGAGRF